MNMPTVSPYASSPSEISKGGDMLTLWTQVTTWLASRDERGASMVEYALLVVLIAIVALIAISLVG
ncbi:MAG: Flp family type IVb pilin, partial [Acidimicrobiia bacterium]